MKILVFGATGFIGFPVAQALVRAGHAVYGVTRSEEKARKLAEEEITPIVTQVPDISKWIGLVDSLDVIIDSIGGTNIRAISAELLNVTENWARGRPQGSPKLTYIYTSGTWVHGDDHKNIKTDTSPITNPIEFISWLPAQEQRVLVNPLLNGIVIRPSLLYGRSGSLLGTLFKTASEGRVAWFGEPDDRWALIHTDDLAELYVLAAQKAQLIGGKVFDAANDFTESVEDVLKSLAKIIGVSSPPQYLKPTTPFETALTTTALLRPYLGRELLGWRPRKAGLVDNLEVYYNAWKASEKL